MNDILYFSLCGVCVVSVLLGINLMSKVKFAVTGNALSAFAMLFAMVLTAIRYGITSQAILYAALVIGAILGMILAGKAKMISMPQIIALLNGLGGAASAVVAGVTAILGGISIFEDATAGIALAVGAVTFTGSMVAAGKLARILDARPKVLPMHTLTVSLLAILTAVSIVLQVIFGGIFAIATAIFSLLLGYIFVLRVGGADMPITISLLNSLSGVAGGIAGMAINEPLLVVIGGVVGASGLILTQDMCKAMNRKLTAILSGKTTASTSRPEENAAPVQTETVKEEAVACITEDDVATTLKNAKKVLIVPGYGMALSQAQSAVSFLAQKLESGGAEVKFAIHPVAGRMPGHMSVLLCEADIDYEKLYMMEDINDDFASCDIAVIIGANDVTNPAANTAEGTPIYGMPVLNVADAPMAVFLNFDTKPGYAGVPNPLYDDPRVLLMLGDAKESVNKLLGFLQA